MNRNDQQTKKIKVELKCSKEAKTKFKSSRCLLTISVGQESHEGALLGATIELIKNHFGLCLITLHDTLQRYTMALNRKEDPNYFQEIALREGKAWLERNKKYYTNLKSPLKIISWNDWLNHPNYNEWLLKIKQEINMDTSYKKIFTDTVTEYLDRYCKRLNDPSLFDYKRAQKLCHDYLVEECAILCLWPETNCQFEIYTGNHNAAVKETLKRFVFPKHPDLLHSVKVRFRHKKSLHAQHFEIEQTS